MHKVCVQAHKEGQNAQRVLLQETMYHVKQMEQEAATRREQTSDAQVFYDDVVVSCYNSSEAPVLIARLLWQHRDPDGL